jgi:hypothetical protein
MVTLKSFPAKSPDVTIKDFICISDDVDSYDEWHFEDLRFDVAADVMRAEVSP